MKNLLFLLFSVLIFGQNTTINVTVPKNTNEVYITGNQDILGNWEPSKIKMQKLSDSVFSISLKLKFPAEFKFTRGNWITEAILENYEEQNNEYPNLKIDKKISEINFRVKNWLDNVNYSNPNIISKNLTSKYFPNEFRLIKISVPKYYDPSKKYPVIYTLDGFSLFDLVNNNVNNLSNTFKDFNQNVIPECIVVGIFHNNRGFETKPNLGYNSIKEPEPQYFEGSEKLKNFLFYEIIPQINQKYSTSGYNIIIGHSNTAHFVMNLLFQNDNPFRGIISLSLSGESKILQKLLYDYFKKNDNENVFIGYGSKDLDFSKTSKFLEVKMNERELENENLKITKFNATHSQMPSTAIPDAIKFMFNRYQNFDDFAKISAEKKFNIENYIKNYNSVLQNVYGINENFSENDFEFLLQNTIENKNLEVFNQIINYYEKKYQIPYNIYLKFYFTKEIKDFKNAEKYLIEIFNTIAPKELENRDLTTFVNFFDKTKKPKEAIYFLEKYKPKFTNLNLEFNYFIAKIAIENKINFPKTKKYLNFCIKNYKENRYFTKEKLYDLIKLYK